MDIPISKEIIAKKKRKRILIICGCILLVLVFVFLVRKSFTSSISYKSITVSTVERGNVENTISASGLIQPEFEEVITSPISASIEKVSMDVGSHVKEGEQIMTLDKSMIQTEFEKLKFEAELKRSNIEKIKLEINKSYYDLKSSNDIKQLLINSLSASVENAKKLYKAGGGTKEDIEQAELKLKIAQVEKKQLENEISNKQQTMRVEIRESEIAASIQGKDLHELERKLLLADIRASRSGVVTWVNKNIGSAVHEGEELTRVADLATFKVVGSISDAYIDQLKKGMIAIIRINDTQLRGTVINIFPSVQNGFVSFDIQLNEKNNKLYRPNMKVDIFLVTETHTNVLRVANGAAFNASPIQDIFIVKNEKAIREKVRIGMSNFDYIEITDKVNVGDQIITSDMSNYKNMKEIKLKK